MDASVRPVAVVAPFVARYAEARSAVDAGAARPILEAARGWATPLRGTAAFGTPGVVAVASA